MGQLAPRARARVGGRLTADRGEDAIPPAPRASAGVAAVRPGPWPVLAGLLCACALAALAAPPAHALDTAALRAKLARQMVRAGAFAGAYVRDLDTGQALYAHNENIARPPASVEKLYTTSTALLRFGPDEHLTTRVVGAGALDAQ